jgi:hypothetical protein
LLEQGLVTGVQRPSGERVPVTTHHFGGVPAHARLLKHAYELEPQLRVVVE